MNPIQKEERSDVLDILRGIALLGICMANYPGFSLYIFQTHEARAAMPTAAIDKWVSYFLLAFVDGRFYSLFSLLFGIGFSIILMRNSNAGRDGLSFFYRRVFILIAIGFAHIMLWSGDILLLYGMLGLLLPLFRNVSNRNLIIVSVSLILSPLLFDIVKVLTDGSWDISNPVRNFALKYDATLGLNDTNFRDWAAVREDYSSFFQFNKSGFFWRWDQLLYSNRLPKVFGMFLLGLFVGRNLLHIKLKENLPALRSVQKWGFLIGLPCGILNAWFEFDDIHLPKPFGLLDTIAYALCVVPMCLAYTATISIWYVNGHKWLKIFAAPGRMALTNYMMQTAFGIFLFYGIGLGFGAKTGLAYSVLAGILVYIIQVIISNLWFKHFNFGPMEWLWRQLTYGKLMPIRKNKLSEAVRG